MTALRRRLEVANHRGTRVPRTLGFWLAGGAIVSTVLVAVGPPGPVRAAGWGSLVASLLVFGAGLVDDLSPEGARGLRNHVKALLGGHPSSGIVKVIVVCGAAVVAIALQGEGSGVERVSGVVLVAAAANVWNGLDVRPGRALKFALIATPALVGIALARVPTLPGVLIASLGALAPDLRERGMLGDAGSNLLGFTVGLGLFVALPGWGVVVAAPVAVGLNVVAETVTFSRVIEATLPLAWFDRLGRLPDEPPTVSGA